MSKPEQLIYKAAGLLDAKRDARGAEAALREAVRASSASDDLPHLVEAKTFLGEVLVQLGREDEAITEFEDVLEIYRTSEIERDLIEPCLRTAREYVAKASGLE